MSKREPDDTPKPAGAPTTEGGRRPGAYYYDDATGYEPYDPAEDDGDEEEGNGEEEEEGDEDADPVGGDSGGRRQP